MIKSFEHKGLEDFFYEGDKSGIQPKHSKGIKKRKPTHPGGILKRHYIEPLSLTVSEIAKELGVSRKAVSKIINEKGSITSDMALRLSKALIRLLNCG